MRNAMQQCDICIFNTRDKAQVLILPWANCPPVTYWGQGGRPDFSQADRVLARAVRYGSPGLRSAGRNF